MYLYFLCILVVYDLYFVLKKPHSDPRTENYQSGRKSSGCGASAIVTDS